MIATLEFKVVITLDSEDLDRIDAVEIGEEISAAIERQRAMSGLASDDDPSVVTAVSVAHIARK